MKTSMLRKQNLALPILSLVICVSGWLPAPAEAAQSTQTVSFARPAEVGQELVIQHNRSTIIRFDRPLQRVSLADPSLVEAIVISPTELLVNGKVIGSSSMIAWSTTEPDRPVAFTVRVVANIQPIIDQITTLFPNEDIRVEQVDGRAILSGNVSSQQVIDSILPLFEGTGLKAINLTQVAREQAPTQVMLQVRVAEINRQVMRELGAAFDILDRRTSGFIGTNQFHSPSGSLPPGSAILGFTDAVNLSIFNPASNLGSFVRALQQRNAFRSLAEPNIIAIDGQEASFLAGGEFPFAVVQPSSIGTTITIQFKEFGVRLKFTPTIMPGNRIRLQLDPEVSELDFSNALQISGFVVPSLRSRRASTTVELTDGQSFALAGLLSNDLTRVDSKIPLLGDIPILGYLFRSQSWQKNETELVFLCTARVVRPLEPNELPPLPGVEPSLGAEGLEGSFGHQVPPVRARDPEAAPQGGDERPARPTSPEAKPQAPETEPKP